jgi:hypothetical protein
MLTGSVFGNSHPDQSPDKPADGAADTQSRETRHDRSDRNEGSNTRDGESAYAGQNA